MDITWTLVYFWWARRSSGWEIKLIPIAAVHHLVKWFLHHSTVFADLLQMYQISPKSDDRRLSYWWLDKFPADFQHPACDFVPSSSQRWGNLHQILWGLTNHRRSTRVSHFRQAYCFVSKLERLKVDWDRKSRSNCRLFDPLPYKIYGGVGEMSEWILRP